MTPRSSIDGWPTTQKQLRITVAFAAGPLLALLDLGRWTPGQIS